MPYYDFQCQDCQKTTEVKATISAKEEGLDLNCPECDSKNMTQVFKSMSFIGAAPGDSMPQMGCGPDGGGCACFPEG